jgi:predicted dehydrogenase
VGVVGIGFGREVHVPAFRSDDRCRIVGICASTLERARPVAAALGIAKAFDSWREMAEDPGIDVLTIAVPPALQPSVVEAAARAGKHVFCEKPAGRDVAQVRRMVAAVQEAGVVHAIDFLFPEVHAWRRAKTLLEDGALGRLQHAALSWRVETFAHRAKRGSWKLYREPGGGTLNNFAAHSLHYLEWLLGPIHRLAAWLTPPAAAGDTCVDAWLEFKTGVPATISIAADAFLGSGHRLEAYGDDGTLVLENHGPDYVDGFTVSLGTRATGRFSRGGDDLPTPGADGRIVAVRNIARRFLDAVLSGGSVTPNLADGLRVQVLLEAIRTADGTGTWQTVSSEGRRVGDE